MEIFTCVPWEFVVKAYMMSTKFHVLMMMALLYNILLVRKLSPTKYDNAMHIGTTTSFMKAISFFLDFLTWLVIHKKLLIACIKKGRVDFEIHVPLL